MGNYVISGSNATSNHYSISYSTGVLSITKAPLTAKVENTSKEYGSSNPSFCMEFVGLKNGEKTPVWSSSPSYTTSATIKSSVGEYEISAKAPPQEL